MGAVLRQCVIVCALALEACGASQPPPSSSAPVLGDPRFPIVPLHLTAMEGARGAYAHADLELRSDATLASGSDVVGRIAGARIVDARGRELYAAVPDAPVTIQRRHRRVQITDDGALLFDDNERIYFDDQGRVVSSKPGQRPQWLNLQMSGLRPDAMRTAAIMVLFTLIHGAHR